MQTQLYTSVSRRRRRHEGYNFTAAAAAAVSRVLGRLTQFILHSSSLPASLQIGRATHTAPPRRCPTGAMWDLFSNKTFSYFVARYATARGPVSELTTASRTRNYARKLASVWVSKTQLRYYKPARASRIAWCICLYFRLQFTVHRHGRKKHKTRKRFNIIIMKLTFYIGVTRHKSALPWFHHWLRIRGVF